MSSLVHKIVIYLSGLGWTQLEPHQHARAESLYVSYQRIVELGFCVAFPPLHSLFLAHPLLFSPCTGKSSNLCYQLKEKIDPTNWWVPGNIKWQDNSVVLLLPPTDNPAIVCSVTVLTALWEVRSREHFPCCFGLPLSGY